MQKQQKLVLASIIIFLLGGLVLAFYLAKNITKPAPKAAENKVTITLQPSNPEPQPQDRINLAVLATAPEDIPIKSLFLSIKYDPEKIRVRRVLNENETDPFDKWEYTDLQIDQTAGYINIAAEALTNKDDPYLTEAAIFATIRLEWIGNSPATLSLVNTDSTSGAYDLEGNFIAAQASPLTIPSDQTEPTEPTNSQEPTTIPEEPPNPPEDLSENCQLLFDKIRTSFSSQCGNETYDKAADVNKDKYVTLLDFSSLAANSTDDQWCQEKLEDETDPCIVPELSFKIAFQGVTPQTVEEERSAELPDPKQQTVRVKIVNPALNINETFPDVSVAYSQDDSTDAKAVYKGALALDEVPPGSGYLVFIKGPRHLQKLFCQNQPIGPCRGRLNSQITFAAGKNEYDLSTLALEAGDLPDPDADMIQDGVADARDWERLRALNAIPQDQITNQDLLVADLDLNGRVDLRDTGLLTDTLFEKYEEDEEAGFGIF